MQIFNFFHNLAVFLFSKIVTFMINWYDKTSFHLAYENSRPSSLQARNATRAGSEEGRLFSQPTPSRETPLGPGALKDAAVRFSQATFRPIQSVIMLVINKSESLCGSTE